MSQREIQGSLFLIGFMGAGKSAVSARFHEFYGMELLEMDQEIERREKMSISRIFREKGEEYFRRLETELLGELKGSSGIVVSCGGGAAMRDENVRRMKEAGKVVLLRAEPETVLQRIADSEDRPLLQGRKTPQGIRELMEHRQPRYEAAADFAVDTDGKTVDQICREILEKISGPESF